MSEMEKQGYGDMKIILDVTALKTTNAGTCRIYRCGLRKKDKKLLKMDFYIKEKLQKKG
ncbi:MAG: hypothetical protein ACPLW7_06880 [Minisyncoccia bacterium]|jgi:hypothetical protein